jgi:azobenzene reductase
MMHIVFVSGSHRQNSETGRVAGYMAARIPALFSDVTADVIKLDANPLPLWDEGMWQAGSESQTRFAPYAERLTRADAYVLLAPEYAGMAAPALKNFLLYTNEQMTGHKPAMLTAVSAARGGAYPISDLRSFSAKNNKMIYIPEHIIVRDVPQMLKGVAPSGPDDEYIRNRIDFGLTQLVHYARAFQPLRQSGVLTDSRYPFGM